MSGRPAPWRLRQGSFRTGLVLVSVLAVASLGACAPPTPPQQAVVTKSVAGPSILSPKAGSARAALATLAVRGRAAKTGYDRGLFGQAWADVDRNGCDTRNDILRRDLTAYQLKSGTHGCLVRSGTLHDPYTGTTIAFVRGQNTSRRLACSTGSGTGSEARSRLV